MISNKLILYYQAKQKDQWHSFDRQPWKHPWLTESNLRNMRVFSEEIRFQAKLIRAKLKKNDPKFGFVCNIANSMYTLSKALRPTGADITLVTHPGDDNIMSQPEWEEYDGFLKENIKSFSEAIRQGYVFSKVDHVLRGEITSNWVSYDQMPSYVTQENYYQWRDYYAYLPVMKTLRQFDSLFAIQSPYLAYLSGKPYMAWHMGGDIWYECSRNDMLGQLQRASFSNASIFVASNPWSYAFARRYGMRNMIYMPTPLNTHDYQLGLPEYREPWEEETGGSFFVLTSARLDDLFKGSNIALEGFLQFSIKNPHARLLLIGWGADLQGYQVRIEQMGLIGKVKVIPPVGKKRLIKYLRSAHCLLDQFVLGYYGMTALEAMAVGLPVIMRLEKDHYEAFSDAGCPPILNAKNAQEVSDILSVLAKDTDMLREAGEKNREWFMNYSGSAEWADAYVDLLTVIASGHKFNFRHSPLSAPLSSEEIIYHQNELNNAPPFPNYL